MNATEVKNLLTPVPTEDFITTNFTDEVSKCCVIGHLARLTSDEPNNFSLGNCADVEYFLWMHEPIEAKIDVYNFARKKVNGFLGEDENGNYTTLAEVNNRPIGKYNQETPKERVIALLDDMIEAGY